MASWLSTADCGCCRFELLVSLYATMLVVVVFFGSAGRVWVAVEIYKA